MKYSLKFLLFHCILKDEGYTIDKYHENLWVFTET